MLACLLNFASTGRLNAAEYIGGLKCKGCHEEQYSHWHGSHHDLAMQEATDNTVLGNFDNVEFSQFGVTSRFFRKDGKFMVRTDGPDGELHDYVIQYTFGVSPLQQYLILFPGGRLQVLDIAWDSRTKEESGQRWFHLHPDEKIAAGDVLHWTGPNLNWNYMCADCHSTNLKKELGAATGAYKTIWSEIDVSCEACHGSGSSHQEWAKSSAEGKTTGIAGKGLTVQLNERKGVHWSVDEKSGKPRRSTANDQRAEIDVCARCHSRRSQLTDDWHPGMSFLDGYRPALLDEHLYFSDGQMRDEVYVWGSFLQSRMYQAGVTCSDCHDPHRAGLKIPGEQVCYQCHQKARYATRKHHFHDESKKGANCVECHMPATTFMQVDDRHDHGFRVPRPDLSISMGVPNACNRCHEDRTADWALERIKRWYGHPPKGYQQFASALQDGRTGGAGNLSVLLDLVRNFAQPVIARATALALLPGINSQTVLMTVQQVTTQDEPLLLLGALRALESVPQRMRILAFPLVWDEHKAVRIEAARLMAGYPRDKFKPGQAEVMDQAIEEYIQTQAFNGERPEAQVNLGNLYRDMKQFSRAEAAYRKAIRLQPQFVPAYVNLAQMLAGRGREKEAAGFLESGIEYVPDSAELYHALGLSLVRQKKTKAALAPLARAAELDRDNMRLAYVYAVALQSTGQLNKALDVLARGLQRHPDNIELLMLLVAYNREAGNKDQALFYARKMQKILPGNARVDEISRQLEKELVE